MLDVETPSESKEKDRRAVSRYDWVRLISKRMTYFAGLYVAHLMASPREQPVNFAKLRTHLSRVTTLVTLRRGVSSRDAVDANALKDGTFHSPASKSVRALDVQLIALLDDTFSVPPVMNSITHVGI